MAEELLTIPEAARRLGLKQKTIRRWVALRKIEFIKTGERAVRISSGEVSRIIEDGRTPRLRRTGPQCPAANAIPSTGEERGQ